MTESTNVNVEEHIDSNVVVQPPTVQQVVVSQSGSVAVVVAQQGVASVVTTASQRVDVQALGIIGEEGPAGPPGQAGQGALTDANPTPVSIGGIPAGTTFDNVPLQDVLQELLYPYQAPSGSLSMSGQATTLEVGTPVSGTKTFTWSFSHPENIVAGSVELLDGATVLASGKNATDSATAAVSLTPSTPGSHSWTLQGTDVKGTVISASFTVSWYWKLFVGDSANAVLTGAQINALTGNLASGGSGTFSYAAGGYKFYVQPASFGAPSSFTDTSTNLSITMADATDDASYLYTDNGLFFAVVSVTNSQGVATNYRVYRSRYVLGGAIQIRVA